MAIQKNCKVAKEIDAARDYLLEETAVFSLMYEREWAIGANLQKKLGNPVKFQYFSLSAGGFPVGPEAFGSAVSGTVLFFWRCQQQFN